LHSFRDTTTYWPKIANFFASPYLARCTDWASRRNVWSHDKVAHLSKVHRRSSSNWHSLQRLWSQLARRN